jgi:predicted O-methyltransferase YrrM
VVLTDYSSSIWLTPKIFSKAGLSERTEFRVGDALRIGGEYENIDLLFIDIDKYQYLEAIMVMLPKLAENALVIADNALWHGTVAEENSEFKDSGAVRQFNEFMFSHGDFFTSIVPLRDGAAGTSVGSCRSI